jgi:putative membrane protein
MRFLIALLLNAFALFITSQVVGGFDINNIWVSIIAALIIGLVNTLLRPLLNFITAPINLLTLGLFSFIVNAIILYVSAWIVPGFEIDGAGSAIMGAVVLAIVSTVLSILVKEVKSVKSPKKSKKKR